MPPVVSPWYWGTIALMTSALSSMDAPIGRWYPSREKRFSLISKCCLSSGTVLSNTGSSPMGISTASSSGETVGTMLFSTSASSLLHRAKYSSARFRYSSGLVTYSLKYGLSCSIICSDSSASFSTETVSSGYSISTSAGSEKYTVHIQSCPKRKSLFVSTK